MSFVLSRRASLVTSFRPTPIKATRPIVKRIMTVNASSDISGKAENLKDAVGNRLNQGADKVKEVVSDVGSDAGAVKDSTQKSASEAFEAAKHTASDVASDIQKNASKAGDAVKDKVGDALDAITKKIK